MTTPKPGAALPVQPFGRTQAGVDTQLYTLANDRLLVQITNFGGRMVRIQAPDRDGQLGDVLLGFSDTGAYITNGGAFGALLGRCANRIAGASFTLDGHDYALSQNDGSATLHGGAIGFDKVVWTVAAAEAEPVPRLVLTHVSADGDQGFPGELSVRATYQLEADSLTLAFHAEATRPTIVNLSAHPYFNLLGAAGGDVLGHQVTIPADHVLPTDRAQIPTGALRPVAGTPFDFRQPTALGARIRQADPQLLAALGYDHCFVLATGIPSEPALAARVHDPVSGRVLEINTDQPGLQVYTGNKLTGAFAGHDGVIYRQAAGLALEAQGFPDAPHHPAFPSVVLRPGQVYRRVIRYRFSVA